MSLHRLLFGFLAVARLAWSTGATVVPPSYSNASVVNSASYAADDMAPNTMVSIFGTNLSYVTADASNNTIDGGIPYTLGGVQVVIDGFAAGIYYVSPTQINFLVPSLFLPGTHRLYTVRDSLMGPVLTITLNQTAPALFADTNGNAIATHLDGSLVNSASPAHPGEWVVLYGVGLGRTVPDSLNYTPDNGAAPLAQTTTFSILANGVPLDPTAIGYAGLAPGFVGLYQINLKLPDDIPVDPNLTLVTGQTQSQTSPVIAVEPS